jgi:hypothetical protein
MSDILQDDRVKWIRQKVVLALEISTEAFDDHFKETLERARSAGIAREQLAQYLSEKCVAGTALFFSANSWAEDIEGTSTKSWAYTLPNVPVTLTSFG